MHQKKGADFMYIIKNALRCIGRSKGRNILIGIIVLVIAVSACIGLSIRQAAVSAREETLSGMKVTATISFDRKSMMSSMTAGGKFDKSQFADMMGASSSLTLEDYQKYATADSVQDFYYTLTASLDSTDEFEAVTAEASDESENSSDNNMSGFGGRPNNNIMGMSSGDFSVIGYSSDAAMTAFIEGTAYINECSVFEEGGTAYECIISQELAAYNSTSVGDVITLVNPNNEEEAYGLTVVGIYTDESTNEEYQSMRESDPANKIYTSYSVLDSIITASSDNSVTATDETTGREYETAVTGNLSATYVFADTDSYYLFESEVRTLGLADSYTVSSQDINSFENSLVPLNTLSTMAGWFLIVILIIGAIILIVMNIFNIRERKYEIGVLLAMGMKKGKVALQFLTEIFVVTILAVIIGVGVGAVSAVPVTNALLENQITSSENKSNEIKDNFGRGEMPNISGINQNNGNMQKPAVSGGFQNIFGEDTANYVSEVNSAMNFTVVLQMLAIALLLTIVAGVVSILFVMRYEPLKILANRD